MNIELEEDEKNIFLMSTINVRLKSHKNIKKTTVNKFRPLFSLNTKLADLTAYQVILLFYGQSLGLFTLDVDLPIKNISYLDQYRNKFLDYIRQNACYKQMNYYLHQLDRYLSTSTHEPNKCLVILQDKFNKLNIVIIDAEKNIVDSLILDASLVNDAWSNIHFEIAKILIRHDINQVIYAVYNNFNKILLSILDKIKQNYQDQYLNVTSLPLLGAISFANKKLSLQRYNNYDEAHRACVFLAMHFWDPRSAFALLEAEDLIFDPLQQVFDQKIWLNKLKKLIHPEKLQVPKTQISALDNALSVALGKINFKNNDS